MKTLKVQWTGIRPLIMENAAMIDPRNEIVRELKRLNHRYKEAAKKRDNEEQTDALADEMDRLKWMGSAYWRDGIGFFVPADNIAKALRDGAAKSKKGKDIQAAAIIDEIEVPVGGIDKRQKLKDYYGHESEFVLRCPIRIPPKTGARVMADKVCIPTGWTLSFSVSYDESLISEQSLLTAMEDSGALVGIGGWRPKFGRFTVEVVK